MEVVIAENQDLIYIGVKAPNEQSMSWEALQEIKDRYYKDKVFVEIYPEQKDIINKANERHLFHIKNTKVTLPTLSDLERDDFEIRIETV